MCSSPKVDDSIQRQMLKESQEARQREEERQQRIKEGTAKIDQIFDGGGGYRGFDDAFYNERRDAFMNFYQPQLDEQFGKAKDQLTFALARAGTLNSTIAADKQADLTSQYDVHRASILSQADAEVAATKNRINQEKSALVSQLNATGDADRAANEALARTQQLYQERPAYNTLGDIFGGIANGIGNYFNAQQNTALYNNYFSGGTVRNNNRSFYTVR